MIVANIHNAKTHLSKLIDQAESGEEVVIARNGKPVVRLTPVDPPPVAQRRPDGLPAWMGTMREEIKVGPAFDLYDEEIAAAFKGSRIDPAS